MDLKVQETSKVRERRQAERIKDCEEGRRLGEEWMKEMQEGRRDLQRRRNEVEEDDQRERESGTRLEEV